MPPRYLCFVGDSFVQGYGDPDMRGWVGRVCADTAALGHDLTVFNLGIRGQTSGQIATRWHPEAELRLSPRPYAQRGLVFSFGANDVAQGVGLAQSQACTEAILEQARTLAPILLIGPAPIADTPAADSQLQALCGMMAACAGRLGIAYLPIFAALRQNPTWMDEALAADGAHPAAGGYAALADLVRGWSAWQDWFG